MSYGPYLPPEYRAFAELELCSNRLFNVQIPLGLNGDPLILVGYRGSLPLVWLAGPTTPAGNTWSYVVKASKSANPAVRVLYDKNRRGLKIIVDGNDILRAYQESQARAVVAYLNLRPLGLEVVGTKSGLQLGGSSFEGNTLQNLRVGFDLAAPDVRLLGA